MPSKPAFVALALLLPLLSLDALAQQFVSVGYGGRRTTSTDGKKWENLAEWSPKGGDDSDNLMSIATGHGKFVAVGGGGFSKDSQKGHILVSTDGKVWKPAGDWPNRVNPVVFGGKRFVAGGGGDLQLIYSDDGLSWKKGASVKPDGPGWAWWFRRGVHGNDRYILFGDHDTTNPRRNFCLVTRSGETVEKIDYDFPAVASVAFGNGIFALVTRDGKLMTSKDGLDWKNTAELGDKPLGLAFNGRLFFTGTSGKLVTSSDGHSWKETPGSKLPGSIIAARDNTLLATSWPANLFYSTDSGKTWSKAESPSGNAINAVAFGPRK